MHAEDSNNINLNCSLFAVDSPGIAFYSAAPLSAGETLIKIIVDSAPVLIVMAIIVLIAGTMYWLLVSDLSFQTPRVLLCT